MMIVELQVAAVILGVVAIGGVIAEAVVVVESVVALLAAVVVMKILPSGEAPTPPSAPADVKDRRQRQLATQEGKTTSARLSARGAACLQANDAACLPAREAACAAPLDKNARCDHNCCYYRTWGSRNSPPPSPPCGWVSKVEIVDN